MYTNILVATDGSKLSGKAVAHAIELARALSARLTAFHASPDYPLPVYADGVVYETLSRSEYAAACRARRRMPSPRHPGKPSSPQ